MAKSKKNSKTPDNTIAQNRKARFDYHIEDDYEAGLSLEGWEIKSLRAGRVQINDSYIFLRNGEAFLVAALITPLPTASTHIHPDSKRARKLLMHRKELDKLTGLVERQSYTIVPLTLYWKNNRVKIKIALAKGKQKHDKRATEKDRDWQRDKQRILRNKH